MNVWKHSATLSATVFVGLATFLVLHFTLIPLRALILQFLRECSSGLPGESGNRFPFLTGLPFGIFSTILRVEGKNVRSMSGEGCDEALMRGNPVLIRTSIYRFSLNKLIWIISCVVSYVGQLKIYIHASRFFFANYGMQKRSNTKHITYRMELSKTVSYSKQMRCLAIYFGKTPLFILCVSSCWSRAVKSMLFLCEWKAYLLHLDVLEVYIFAYISPA